MSAPTAAVRPASLDARAVIGTPPDIVRKNRELYDDTFGPVWRQAVFDGMHGGREFINLGGEELIRAIGHQAPLTSGCRVLELCSGPGAVAVRIAELYGCAVTGVDMNPKQVAHARAMAHQRDDVGLEFIEADVCAWTPHRRYETVVSIDAFMLLADPAAALSVAYEALNDGGRLAVATLAAGPRITRRFRRFAAEIDGMVNLRAGSSYRRLATGAGFADVSVHEMTALAVRASNTMISSIRQARRTISALSGPGAYDGWIRVSQAYLDAFTSDCLRYILVTATRPRSDRRS